MTDTQQSEAVTGKAREAAGTAADEGKHLAGVAQQEASRVAGEAATQVKSLVGEARTQVGDQVGEQTRDQRDKLVSTLGSIGDDLESMADNADGGGIAADLAREVAGHARSLTSYLDGKEPTELLEDVRDFARRRPGVFLLGALAAGVVAGRLARGVKDAPSAPSADRSPTTGFDAPTAAMPTTPPPTPPVTPSTPAPGLAAPPTGLPSDLEAGTATGTAPIPGYATQPPTSDPFPGGTSS